jgi:hypothetical protein
VWVTTFGSPVVPEVKNMNNGSLDRVSAASASDDSLRPASTWVHPGRSPPTMSLIGIGWPIDISVQSIFFALTGSASTAPGRSWWNRYSMSWGVRMVAAGTRTNPPLIAA